MVTKGCEYYSKGLFAYVDTQKQHSDDHYACSLVSRQLNDFVSCALLDEITPRPEGLNQRERSLK